MSGLENVHASDIEVGTNKVIFGVDHLLALRSHDYELSIQGDQSRRRIGRIYGDASFRAEDCMFAISADWCVGVAEVASRAIAGPAGAVVPAPGILGDISADRALIADLRGSDQLGCLRQQTIVLPYDGVLRNIGKGGHRSDFHATGDVPNSLQFVDAAEIDDHLRFPDTVLEPIHAIEPA